MLGRQDESHLSGDGRKAEQGNWNQVHTFYIHQLQPPDSFMKLDREWKCGEGQM